MKQKVKCPFCDKSDIFVEHIPLTKRNSLQRCRAGSGGVIYSKEKWFALDNCKNCGASKEKIEKALNSGEDYKKPSRSKIIERMKKSGLPTRI